MSEPGNAALPEAALDDRVAIVGMAGAGKTYTAKGQVERLLERAVRVCVVDPLGVWWGLRSNAAGDVPGYPAVVFGGLHADVSLSADMGEALGRLIGAEHFASIVDLSELGSSAARRRFMTAFAEAVYDVNREPLHLVLDEADLWSPQRPMPDQTVLLNRIEEIVRRGRVRGFIPWLITQRPAVVHKDVLSQAEILIAMKLTASQDRDAIGAWIEGQADRAEGKRILAELPQLGRGEGYVWAPGHAILERTRFPRIRTFDSSRTPRRGERQRGPQSLAAVDVSAIAAALTEAAKSDAATDDSGAGERSKGSRSRAAPDAQLQRLRDENQRLSAELEAAEGEVRKWRGHVLEIMGALERFRRIDDVAGLVESADPDRIPIRGPRPALSPPPLQAGEGGVGADALTEFARRGIAAQAAADAEIARAAGAVPPAKAQPHTGRAERAANANAAADGVMPSSATKMLAVLARGLTLTWAQTATLAGLKASGGHFNAGRKALRDLGYVGESGEGVTATEAGVASHGGAEPKPDGADELLAWWRTALPRTPARLLDQLHRQGGKWIRKDKLAEFLGLAPRGGHWNSAIAILRRNRLIEERDDKLRTAPELRRENGHG